MLLELFSTGVISVCLQVLKCLPPGQATERPLGGVKKVSPEMRAFLDNTFAGVLLSVLNRFIG